MKHDGNIPPGTPRRVTPNPPVVDLDPEHDDWGVCNLCEDPETAYRTEMTTVGYHAMKLHLIKEHGRDPKDFPQYSLVDHSRTAGRVGPRVMDYDGIQRPFIPSDGLGVRLLSDDGDNITLAIGGIPYHAHRPEQ